MLCCLLKRAFPPLLASTRCPALCARFTLSVHALLQQDAKQGSEGGGILEAEKQVGLAPTAQAVQGARKPIHP